MKYEKHLNNRKQLIRIRCRTSKCVSLKINNQMAKLYRAPDAHRTTESLKWLSVGILMWPDFIAVQRSAQSGFVRFILHLVENEEPTKSDFYV